MNTVYDCGLWRRVRDFLTAPFHSPGTRLVMRLRRRGVKVGRGVVFRDAGSVTIDLTRPSLVEIGDYVDINVNFTIMTHDFASGVFLRKYGELVNSSGAVRLGNNIYIGRDVTILKGVTVGDNCVIGLGSVVMHDVPDNSVVAGCPARVISSLDEYFAKRKSRCVAEAFEYARSIRDRFGRDPRPEDFWEEFPLFVDGGRVDEYPGIPVRRQLGAAYARYVSSHRARFGGWDDFMARAFAQAGGTAEDRESPPPRLRFGMTAELCVDELFAMAGACAA